MKNILGLDLGTNSIGWALVQHDFESKKGGILAAGSRIIPMSQDILGKFDSGQSYSQTAERTGFRGTRRLRERHLLRRERLHRVLNILGFLPRHYAGQIDFEKRLGQFISESEPKLPYAFHPDTNKAAFIFKNSFTEMLQDFAQHLPHLVENDKKVPYDWTIYFLRKKALTQKIEKEELAWLLLNFNQKRGYYQLRGEDDEENQSKRVEYYALLVTDVVATDDKKGDEIWYNVVLENGWIYRRTSKTQLDWKGKCKEFIVTTELNEDGTIKKDKEGKERRSFRAPADNDWNLVKKKTEADLLKSGKTVGTYIYDTLLQNPNQKIKGKLVRVIERKFYKEELEMILNRQKGFHSELNDENLYEACLNELYEHNEAHRNSIAQKDFTHLFINDIIFYQRPLKSKKSLISNCKLESRAFIKDGNLVKVPLKCIAKSHPLFQEFRLWQFLQNLKIYQKEKQINGKLHTDLNVTVEFLKSEDDWVRLFDWLNERKEVDQKALLKQYFKIKSTDGYRWNYVEDKAYPCNETRALIASKLAKVQGLTAGFLTKEREEALWHILYSVEDKIDIQKALKTFASKNSLEDDFIEAFKKFPRIEKDYGSYSAKALKKMLPLMRIGKYWIEEDVMANFDSYQKNIQMVVARLKDKNIEEELETNQLYKSLELLQDDVSAYKGLQKHLASYVAYGKHSEDGEAKKWATVNDIQLLEQHSLRNPIVEQVINETLQVVKSIWNHYGKGEEGFFDEIHIELGREMKNTADERERISQRMIANENTNLRIKALLMELLNDVEVENVRPYSPMQQEILKIYEEGALNSEDNIPDDILKISKMAQPTSKELVRYKLWLQQKYRSPYTGDIIPLNKLFTSAYEIEHIIPQSRYFDDSMGNKVICEAEVNKDKGNSTAYEYIKNNRGKKIELSFGHETTLFTIDAYEDFVKRNYAGNRNKMKKLLMEDIPEAFIQRQLNDSRYISKVVKNLMSNIVREEDEQEAISKNVVVCTGSITAALKQDWGLNDVWNEIITPRFERLNEITRSANFGEWTNKEGKNVFQIQMPLEYQKGFSKKRIDHRHHALDAIIIACATRSHINYLNNYSAIGKVKTKEEKEKMRYDLRNKLCSKKYNDDRKQNYKWIFYKPWETFTQEVREMLNGIVVSFKQNLRVVNKTVNYYQKWKEEDGNWKKIFERQKGENWAIRKPMHKDTVSGSIQLKFKKMVSLSGALDNWEMIANAGIRKKVKQLFADGYNKTKIIAFFKANGNKWQETDLTKVEVYYWDKENAASRVNLDESFNSVKINSVTDSGIRNILREHLGSYNELANGKVIEHPELAFSPDGLDIMNRNIEKLNGGKPHLPIYKVRTFEPLGNKFQVGQKGNKKAKYVEAAKGTNLYFAIYVDDNKKRYYETISLNIVIDRLKQGKSPVPDVNKDGHQLLFHLSPNDLVYVPTEVERENIHAFYFNNSSKAKVEKIYKTVSFSNNQCFFVGNNVSIPVINKFEFSALNKMEKSIEGIMIKEFCVKLNVDRIGRIKQHDKLSLLDEPGVMFKDLSETETKKQKNEEL